MLDYHATMVIVGACVDEVLCESQCPIQIKVVVVGKWLASVLDS